MKKLKTFLCFALVMILALPMFAGCSFGGNNADVNNNEPTYYETQKELSEKLTQTKYALKSLELNLTGYATSNNKYLEIKYTVWANADGGFDSYRLYANQNVSYIVYDSGTKYNKPVGKIVNGQFYSATYNGNNFVSYSSTGESAASKTFILTVDKIETYMNLIRNCTYVCYNNYLINMLTGEATYNTLYGEYTEILFFNSYSDFMYRRISAMIGFNQSNEGINCSTCTCYPHIYYNDNSRYHDLFFYVATSAISNVTADSITSYIS